MILHEAVMNRIHAVFFSGERINKLQGGLQMNANMTERLRYCMYKQCIFFSKQGKYKN